MRKIPCLMLCSVALVALVGCSSDPPSSGVPPTIEADRTSEVGSQFAGAWALVAIERRGSDGELIAPASHDRIGHLLYDASGHMGVTIMSPDRPPYSGNTATEEEALAALTTYTAYFGGYTVHEADGYVTHHVEGSLDPSGAGSDYRRVYSFDGNRLTLQPPASENGDTTSLIWERLPPLPDSALTDTHRRLFGVYRIESVSRQVVGGQEVPADQYDTAFILYTQSGHMAAHLMRPGRRPYAGARPTSEEALAALRTYGGYFGSFSVNEDDGYLVHHRIGGVRPSAAGSDAQRFYELTATHLTLQPPAGTDDEGRAVQSRLRWRRISE